jgi:hypothetical protein
VIGMENVTPEQNVHGAPPQHMTGPWSFDLEYIRAPKGLSQNDRAGWRQVARSTAILRMDVMYRTRAAHVPALGRIRVDVEWVVKDRRVRDSDNLSPMLKAIYDGIGSNRGVSARIVEDDNPTYMEKPAATIRYEKGCTPHFTVTITDLGEPL